MIALLKLILCLFFIIYLFGAIASIFIFAFDVIKWHSKEERVKIVPSAELEESEVITDERGDNGSAASRSGDRGSSGAGESDRGNSGNNIELTSGAYNGTTDFF